MYARSSLVFCPNFYWPTIEGPRTRVVQPKMKCGKLSKYHKNDIKSGLYLSEKHEIFLIY